MIKLLKEFFRANDLFSKIAVFLFVVNIMLFYYYGIAWDCSYKNCAGASGLKFWFAANLAPFLAHFVFWAHDKTDGLSEFLPFRIFMVVLSYFGHIIWFVGLIDLMNG